MNRYPDTIIILEPVGGDPYNEPTWRQVYTGRCRCFLHREAAFRTNKVMDCDYQVVIPDRNMVTIGENFKVGVKMHTDQSSRNWDLVGYVKDFARYDRVCNLNFQSVKENLIYEDIPEPAIDTKELKMNYYDDDYIHIESPALVSGSFLLPNIPIVARLKQDNLHLVMYDPDEESEQVPATNLLYIHTHSIEHDERETIETIFAVGTQSKQLIMQIEDDGETPQVYQRIIFTIVGG